MLLLHRRFSHMVNESGFVLVLSLVVLLILSLFGVWALRTSTSEVNVAGGLQQAERKLNLAEGGGHAESSNIARTAKDFYNMYDPGRFNQLRIPSNMTEFDPGNDSGLATMPAIDAADPLTWPWDNLITSNAAADNQYDYRYLVTYLTSGPPPQGMPADRLESYSYRIRGNAPDRPGLTTVEVGGKQTGFKGIDK